MPYPNNVIDFYNVNKLHSEKIVFVNKMSNIREILMPYKDISWKTWGYNFDDQDIGDINFWIRIYYKDSKNIGKKWVLICRNYWH